MEGACLPRERQHSEEDPGQEASERAPLVDGCLGHVSRPPNQDGQPAPLMPGSTGWSLYKNLRIPILVIHKSLVQTQAGSMRPN